METLQIIPENYPELRLICWHSDPGKPISEAEAFGLYERNWRYVHHAHLSEEEAALIEYLKRQYGNGVING
jgi:hypothetical protein